METRKKYLRLTLITLFVMAVIEFSVYFVVVNCKPATATTWHYIAIFTNLMILGGVFFKQRSLWEIGMGLYPSEFYKPLTTHLLTISYAITFCFFVVYFFPSRVWEEVIPYKFQYLFNTPALISGIVLLVLTVGGQFMRHFEADY